MKILITGANGFVGKNLIKYLRENDLKDILVLKRESLLTINTADVENVNMFIHLAGKAHDLKNISDPEEYYSVNYELTKKMYDVFLNSNASKFIFISSVKASADYINEILTEEHAPNPQTHYGKSKLLAEEYLLSQKAPVGKSYFILRPCMIHGPGNKGNLTLLYQFVKKGIPYPLAAFNNVRSFLSIENFCFVIKKIIEKSEIQSGVYHIADDQPLSTVDVVKIIAKTIGKKQKLWHVPKSAVKFLAKVGNILHFPLNTEILNKLTENYIVSNTKIVTAIGDDLPLKSADGLKITINSFND